MQFWDTSAIVPLCIHQAMTARVRRIISTDPGMVVWWGAPVEIQRALGRLAREGALNASALIQARTRLAVLRRTWREVLPSQRVRDLAEGLPAHQPVNAGDAFQLAAALLWCREQPRGRSFVSLDRRLSLTAEALGFVGVPL